MVSTRFSSLVEPLFQLLPNLLTEKTMNIILSEAGKQRWISGIYAEAEKAKASFAELPSDATNHKLVTIDLHYPFYIIEDFSGFKYLNEAGLEQHLRACTGMKAEADHDGLLFNIYTIRQDFEARTPGNDEMGYLYHSHVTEEDVADDFIGEYIARFKA